MRIPGPRGGSLIAATAVTGAACLAVLGAAAPAPASAAGRPSAAGQAAAPAASGAVGIWGPVQSLPGNAAFPWAGLPTALTCDGPGDCIASGLANGALPGNNPPGTVAEEKRGVWGTVIAIPGLAALAVGVDNPTDEIDSVSCGSPGNCALAGAVNAVGPQVVPTAFLATERNGTWGTAGAPPGLNALNKGGNDELTSLSCTAPGDCTGGGYYTIENLYNGGPEEDGFVIDEKRGIWGKAGPVPGIANSTGSLAQVLAVSCTSPGNCAAGGFADGNSIGTPHQEAFVAQETKGAWHAATLIPALSEISLLSCPAAGDCAAAGISAAAVNNTEPEDNIVVTEKNGRWGPSRTAKSADINALSCGSAGNCAAVGFTGPFNPPSVQNDETLLIQSRNGTWSAPRQLPGVAALHARDGAMATTVSCPSAGACDVGGIYAVSAARQFGFLTADTGGAWSKVQSVASDGVGVISCFSPDSCAALVGETPGSIDVSLPLYSEVMTKAPVQVTRTALSLSASRVTYGHEQAVRLSVAVSAGLGMPVGLTLIDSGSATVCVIGLTSGAGHCTLARSQLKPGTYTLVAHYLGTPNFIGSASAKRTLTVVK